MKTTKTDKAERRARRDAKKRSKGRDRLRSQPLGGVMDEELVERIIASIQEVDFTAPFVDLAPRILPTLKRVWNPYPAEQQPAVLTLPPGIPTGFGIDFGPAFSHVTQDLLDRWEVDVPTVLATALDNLRSLVRVEPPVVQRFVHDGIDVVGVQGQGWGSALVLVPDVLGPLIEVEPRVLLTPIRNTILSLPQDVDAEAARRLWWALADGAHDVLDVDPLLWTGSDIASVWTPETAALPN